MGKNSNALVLSIGRRKNNLHYSYIAKDEQKEDWASHKKICQILKKARGNRYGP